MDPNDAAVAEANSGLSARGMRDVAYAAVVKYSAIAASRTVDSPFYPADGRFLDVMRMAGEGAWTPDDVSFLGQVSEVVGDYLDTFEEEPDGWGYYRYMAAMLVLIALPNLIGGPGSDTVASLWEFTRRFADHVDWDLGRAQGQHPATPELSFRRREGVVWLRNAELARAGGNTTVIAAESAAWGRTFVAALDVIAR
ncbi:hypothetical protein [Actinacidiphila acidipaludis]|uniref:Uncharacterized protein n=1 Tax=Actinacidiphila acidipaludis TaxID=2873382 RepID=A0ABS7Q146_9ACTN|nr:hypothetical protein [Streptomyces acidipaludis]MBY8876851.1 hypothetical protein [Streptomyces acidipaludis]